jgi:hypothetical protein
MRPSNGLADVLDLKKLLPYLTEFHGRSVGRQHQPIPTNVARIHDLITRATTIRPLDRQQVTDDQVLDP